MTRSFKMEMGFPKEAELAKTERWPVLIPVGTMEYHGPHCVFGCDALVSEKLCEKVAEKIDCVLMPTIWYGVASFAVAGPEKNTIHVDCDTFEQYMYNILKSLIYGGWRNIYMVICHQTEDYNPMQLACMKAARKLVFEYLEETKGLGWWGSNSNAEFYEEFHDGQQDNPWKWITTIGGRHNKTLIEFNGGGDHAGKGECSLLGALVPESLKLDRLSDSDEWFIQSAKETDLEIGNKIVEDEVEDIIKIIKGEK